MLTEHGKQTSYDLSHRITAWMVARGYVSPVDAKVARTALETLITDFMEEVLLHIVKEARRGKD